MTSAEPLLAGPLLAGHSAPSATPRTRTALFLAAFDSQLKWCAGIAAEFGGRGFGTRVVVPDVRSALSPRQIADAGFPGVEHASWAEVLDLAARSDVVVSGLSGPATRTLLFDLAERLGPDGGPVVVSGWVGVIIEKITAGYLDRCGSDVIAVNGREDLRNFGHAAAELGLPPDNLLLAGLPFLGARPAPERGGPIRRVLFADQPTVPGRPEERRFLYQGLLDYAAAHPERDVVLKPRHRLDEDTFHTMRHHPEALLAGVPTPPNFRFDYTSISEQLPEVDLLLTVSSTACLEALDAGCRVGLVLDLGVHERYGNQAFLDSGLLRTWRQLAADEVGRPRPGWLDGYFLGADDRAPTARVADRVEELLARGERPSRGVWASDYFRSAAAFHRGTAALKPSAETHRPGLARRTAGRAARALLPPVLAGPLRSVVRRRRLVRR